MIGAARDAPIPNLHSDPVGPAPDSEISGPAPGFRSRRAAAAPDAHGFRHAFGKTAITFRPGIGIAYMTTFRNRHSEALVAIHSPRRSDAVFESKIHRFGLRNFGSCRRFAFVGRDISRITRLSCGAVAHSRPFSAVGGGLRRGPTAPPRVLNECARKWPISPPLTDCSHPLLGKKWA